jgi:hypothetical protein
LCILVIAPVNRGCFRRLGNFVAEPFKMLNYKFQVASLIEFSSWGRSYLSFFLWYELLEVCYLYGCYKSPIFKNMLVKVFFYYDCRMEMKYFSGSKEAHNWRSWWMPIVIANPLSSTQLPSCLMVVDSVESKLLMRYLSHTTCSCTQLHIHKIIDIKLTHILPFIFSSFCSWTWRMGMRSMLCCTKLVVLWKQVINAWWRANLLGHAVVVGS